MRGTKAKISNKFVIYESDGITIEEEGTFYVDWIDVREHRNRELKETDFWASKDLTMSQAKKDYRAFLRDLPSNYDTPQEAIDAWMAYEIPE
tara:strand:- start:53 stop:328 length:276 start_codon:yes stop_codon:yes gene_type:complete